MQHLKIKLVTAAVALSLAPVATAKETTIKFVGDVTAASDFYELFGPQPYLTGMNGKVASFIFNFDDDNLIGSTGGSSSSYNVLGSVTLDVAGISVTGNSPINLTLGRNENVGSSFYTVSASGNFVYSAYSTYAGETLTWNLPVSISLNGNENLVTSLGVSDPTFYSFQDTDFASSYPILFGRISDNDGNTVLASMGVNWKSFSVASVAAVPEPSTWGMMLIGFGAIGGTLRANRRRMNVRTAYA